MQQLHNASRPLPCAAELLDAVFDVVLLVREQTARQRHHGGMSLMHVRALGVLRLRRGSTLSELADRLALTLSATSRLVDTLVARHLVVRQIPAGNRRTVSLQLTAAGLTAYTRSRRANERELAAILRRLSVPQRGRLRQSMAFLRQAIREQTENGARSS